MRECGLDMRLKTVHMAGAEKSRRTCHKRKVEKYVGPDPIMDLEFYLKFRNIEVKLGRCGIVKRKEKDHFIWKQS